MISCVRLILLTILIICFVSCSEIIYYSDTEIILNNQSVSAVTAARTRGKGGEEWQAANVSTPIPIGGEASFLLPKGSYDFEFSFEAGSSLIRRSIDLHSFDIYTLTIE